MSKQHKIISLLETLTNTCVGMILALIVWFLIRYSGFYEISTTPQEGVEITAIFTAVSILRGYTLRRLYNWQQDKLEILAQDIGRVWQKLHRNRR